MVLVANETEATRPWKMAWIISAIICAKAFHISVSFVQAADLVTSSGLNTQVRLSDTLPDGKVQYDIIGGTRAGANLFHSFGDFNVPNNNIANFLNDTGLATSNVLGRVTGGNVSNIFGTIQTTGFGNANLFLMNPAGIVFGPNATLHVGGSVAFTTADYIRLADGVQFNAIPNATTDALLSTAPVASYGFLGSNPGAITVQGSKLTVPEERGISLIGGNITIQNETLENGTVQSARLSAPNGQINLATTQSPGEFLKDLTVEPFGPNVANIEGASFASFGSVRVTSGSTVDVSQTGNGHVSIRGGQLLLEILNAVLDTAGSSAPPTIASSQDTIVLAPRSSIISQTSSADRGADIRIVANRIAIEGDPSPRGNVAEKPSFTGIRSETGGAGNAGDVILETAGNIETNKVVNLWSVAHASGNAGNVVLTSTHGNIRMIGGGQEAQVFSLTLDKGNTGNVVVSAEAGNVVLNGAALYTLSEGSGRGGLVEIAAQNLWMNTGLLGNGSSKSLIKPNGITVTLSGNLIMTTDSSLVPLPGVLPSSLIFTASPGSSPAADINITAKDIFISQGSSIKSDAFASEAGGDLNIFTDTLKITEGGQLSSGSTRALDSGTLPQHIIPSGPGGDITIQAMGSKGTILIDGHHSGIFTNTEGTGVGGTIHMSARSLMLQNGGKLSAETTGTSPNATGGSISVNAADQVILTTGASITASSVIDPEVSGTGIADAGNIFVNSGQQLEMLDGASIKTTTELAQANGGSIDIRAVDRVRLVNSEISTSVIGAEGSGGNIFIDPNLVLLQGSTVTARAVGGSGGNITFVTPLFLADATSIVSATSKFGPDGKVTARSNLIATIPQLESKAAAPQVLLQNRCIALAGGEQSTFILAGHDALPSQPGGWLSSPVALEHWTEDNMEEHASGLMVRRVKPRDSSPVMTQAQGTEVLSLRRLTPSGFLVRSFAESALTGCRS